MKITREQVAENRQKILDSASELFRRKGVNSVSVAEVMHAAGLTHGGFYGHFASKDDLVAQTFSYTVASYKHEPLNFVCYLERYLSADHRDNPGQGCPFAALASEMRHQSPKARATLTAGVRSVISMMTTELSVSTNESAYDMAIGNWAAMVGAMVLARSVNDEELSDQILSETHRFIMSNLTKSESFRSPRSKYVG